MEYLLEKITLYDILGYLFPGCILTWIVLNRTAAAEAGGCLAQLGGEMKAHHLIFFVVSYLVGIILSEVAEGVRWLLIRLAAKFSLRQKGEKERELKQKGKKHSEDAWTTILHAQVVDALVCSGMRRNKDSKDNKDMITLDLARNREYYFKYMYGRIQGHSECKRVHNYSSAYIMYRNVAMALFIGSVGSFFAGNGWGSIFIGSIVSALFVRRGCRFRKKKELYIVTCFLDRFSSGHNAA